MKRVLMILLVMTSTFFMDGCVSNNEKAIEYFDKIYFPVQDLIELDNSFQESMQNLTVASDQVQSEEDRIIDEQEYSAQLKRVETAYDTLQRFVNENLIYQKDIPVYNNETALQRSAIKLFETYKTVVEKDYRQMVDLLKVQEPADEDNKRFNKLLRESGDILEFELQSFYDTAMEYGDKYQIDLEFNEEE